MVEPLIEKPLHFTPVGTLVRDNWTKKYYNEVLRIEKIANHKVCGAPKKNLKPCKAYPKENYNYYCQIHKTDITTTGSTISNDLPSNNPNNIQDAVSHHNVSLKNYEDEKGIFKHQMPLDYLRRNFAKCNNCPVRADCAQNMPDFHCTIEEDIFNNFLDSTRQDYDIQDFTKVDMFTIYQAAFSFINRIRFQIVKQLYSPTEDNALRIEIAGVRASKEFRENMKSLGLTRDSRQKLRRKDFQIGISAVKATASASLASQMADAKKQEIEKVSN